MEGRFLGREIIAKPCCPFCGIAIEKPKELTTRMPNEMPLGACSCGAVYACDVTGHNLGAAMIEALVFGCNGDWDLAWGLLPEEDYLENLVENYDFENHLIIRGGIYKGRRVAGTLYFIRLQQDIREVTEEGTHQRLEKATVNPARPSSRKGRKRSSTKKEVEQLIRAYDIEPLLTMAEQDKRVIRNLQRLLYSVDRLVRWRTAEALGLASAVIAQSDPGTISRLLQGLFTSVSDTAASSWGALDAIGQIISHSPKHFAGYIPELYRLMGDRALLPEVLDALGKIAQSKPEAMRKKSPHFIPLLQDPDPEIRGFATILLGNLKVPEARDDLAELLNDTASIEVYRDGAIENLTVRQLTSEALEKL